MPFQTLVDGAVQALRQELGANLYSCCLYGSAVRGNFIEGISDINLLIVLSESNPAAHEAIARAIGKEKRIDPFILGWPGFARSARSFAAKFASIKRNYRVVLGADPLADVTIDPELERFLCEQALRNLRLRLVFAFVTRARHSTAYRTFLSRSVTPLFVQFSEVLRLDGMSVPKDFEARIPLIEKQFKIDGTILRELLELKQRAGATSSGQSDQAWHERVFPIVDSVVKWVESKWSGK